MSVERSFDVTSHSRAAAGSHHKKRELTQLRAEETRERILQCARDVFAQQGFAGANVREIARRAGTTHSMITYHFGTKDELWRESVRDMFALLQRQVFDVVEAEAFASTQDRMRRMTHLYARYCAEHPEHARITIAETITGGDRLSWMVEEFVLEAHAKGIPLMQALMDEGLTPKMDVLSLLYAFVGMIQMPFVLAKEAQLAAGHDFMSQEAIERHADAVIAMMMPHAKPT